MLPIISGEQVKHLDQQYISAEGISSLDLMERAANAFVAWFTVAINPDIKQVYIFAGPGNNGGDGVAIARLLQERHYNVHLIYLQEVADCSADFKANYSRLPDKVLVTKFNEWNGIIAECSVIIDGVFGVGINRPIEGVFQRLIQILNKATALKIAIDIPSGLPADQIAFGTVFRADHTVSFQFPKLSLLFPEHASFIGELHIMDIGISEETMDAFQVGRFYLRAKDIPSLHRSFHRFSHKGDYGKVLIIGGAKGKTGAINLSAHAALRTGSGLVHLAPHLEDPYLIQPIISELMLFQDDSKQNLNNFDAIAIGPGWGMGVDIAYYQSILARFQKPIVIDADGLNLLAANPDLIHKIPKNSVLTPHLKEFERLVGKSKDHLERMEKAKNFAIANGLILVLKGAHTLVTLPDGRQIFNSSGNQYMATAGSGDVLTGMIASFLGQGYSPEHAALCGVYHHGLAGELASKSRWRGMIASDIIEAIPRTFLELGIK